MLTSTPKCKNKLGAMWDISRTRTIANIVGARGTVPRKNTPTLYYIIFSKNCQIAKKRKMWYNKRLG